MQRLSALKKLLRSGKILAEVHSSFLNKRDRTRKMTILIINNEMVYFEQQTAVSLP